MILQDTGYFCSTAAISECFYHRHYFRCRFQLLLVLQKIMNDRAKIDLKYGLVGFFFQQPDNPFKCKYPSTFYQYRFIPEGRKPELSDEVISRQESLDSNVLTVTGQ